MKYEQSLLFKVIFRQKLCPSVGEILLCKIFLTAVTVFADGEGRVTLSENF